MTPQIENPRNVFPTREELVDAVKNQADLSRSDLRKMHLTGANLNHARLGGADLSRAHLACASLYRAQLSEANLSGADLYRADLSRADLSGAQLVRTQMESADLSGANLSGADLFCADLSYADLRCADLSGANLCGAYVGCAQGIVAATGLGPHNQTAYAWLGPDGWIVSVPWEEEAGTAKLRETVTKIWTDSDRSARWVAEYVAFFDLVDAKATEVTK